MDDAERYIAEVDTDSALRAHVRAATREHGGNAQADEEAQFGRRIGWYALVRAVKPRLLVETGVDKGLGSCLLCAALMRNAAEGSPGRYIGTDINPSAGFLLQPPYSGTGKILYGDSIESLKKLVAESALIDFFINDSDHSAEYEGREYATIREALAPDAIVLADNAHVTTELIEFAKLTNRAFLYFQEKPANHWYPGAGIGLAFRQPGTTTPGDRSRM
jgi:predicted O-methyltransferase YrrM